MHCVDRAHCVEAVVSWRLEVKGLAEFIEKRFSRSLPDPDGAIALHVAVTTHGTQSGARLSDLPAQQHQVDDLLNVRDGVAMLRQSHRPTEDRTLRIDEDLCGLFDLFSR